MQVVSTRGRGTKTSRRSAVETLERRRLLSVAAFVTQTNLTSDLPGVAAHQNTPALEATRLTALQTNVLLLSAVAPYAREAAAGVEFLTLAQRIILNEKRADTDLVAAEKSVEGTARSLGLEVEG